MQEVRLPARSPLDLGPVIGQERVDHLINDVAPAMQSILGAHSIINVNSTAAGGGVAEMLQVLLPLSRGPAVDARWLVIDGDPPFFALTKRLHNRLHGRRGRRWATGRSRARPLPAGVTRPTSTRWRPSSPMATS